MNYDQIDGSYCKKIYTLSYIYIYIYDIQGFTKTFSKMYPPISLRNIICSILKPRIWINHYVSIQFSPTYLSWQSSLKSFRVTIVYVSRKETKFEKQPITQSEKLLVSFSERSNHRSIDLPFHQAFIFVWLTRLFSPFVSEESRVPRFCFSSFDNGGKKPCWRNRCSILHHLYTQFSEHDVYVVNANFNPRRVAFFRSSPFVH